MNIQEVISKLNQKYEEGVIYKTKNYGLFHRIPGNRIPKQRHIDELVSDISDENMLQENPMTVTNHNGGLGIVAGQHRLKAAEILDEYIYFMFKKNATVKEVRMLGSNTKDWLLNDWLNSIIEEKNSKDYITLKEFASEYKLSLPIAINILTDEFKTRGRIRRDFEGGHFEIKDYDTADRMASLLTEVRMHSNDGAWTDRRCMQALRRFLDSGDPKRLGRKLNEYGLAISKRKSVKEYEAELEHILNFSGTSA